jgi:hypothetical protein
VLETIAIFGMNLGLLLGKPNIYLLIVTAGAATGLAYLLIYLPSQRLKEIEAYRNRQKHLIKL